MFRVAAVAVFLLFSPMDASMAATGSVDSGHAEVFVVQINQLRADLGLAPLVSDPELTAAAQSWAELMAANDELTHSPDITEGISAAWIVLGENVGVDAGSRPRELFLAFVRSPPHYENLVDPRFGHVGIGVVETDDGTLWTTHRFMAIENPPEVVTSSVGPSPIRRELDWPAVVDFASLQAW
jgi:uncharacterized protein YkwD